MQFVNCLLVNIFNNQVATENVFKECFVKGYLKLFLIGKSVLIRMVFILINTVYSKLRNFSFKLRLKIRHFILNDPIFLNQVSTYQLQFLVMKCNK